MESKKTNKTQKKPTTKAQVKQKQPKKKKKRSFAFFVFLLWFFFIAVVGGVFGIFYMTKNHELFGELPDVRDLENPDINVASQIISSDGKLIGTFETEKRIPVTYQDLPPHLVDALLSKEDERFFDHAGVDAEAIARAIRGQLSGDSEGGGSTITQQLAKQLFTKNSGTQNKWERVKQKIKEWVVSVQLEELYTKEEIIAMYFNKFDFIYGAHGIEMASKIYFNTSTKDLTLNQSASLVAMFQNPNKYNPIKNPENAKKAREIVLSQMKKLGKISESEYHENRLEPLGVDRQRVSNVFENFSGYYKHALKKELNQYFKEYEQEYGKKYDIYKDGLKIYITLDTELQKKAEDAVKKHLTRLQREFFRQHRGRKNAPFRRISSKTRDTILIQAVRRTELFKHLKSLGKSNSEIYETFNQPRDSVQFFSWGGSIYKKDVSLMDSIIYHKHIVQAGLMSMDPRDGTIKAWVGGIDWDYFKYDMVKQGRRQVGSTFKPIVYATAINQMNYTPCHVISNTTFRLPGWKVPGGGGSLTLRDALAYSKNPVAARLISSTGIAPVVQLARDMGITNHIQNDFTISLGSSDLTVYEMVGALSTFANGGIYVKPELILRIEDENGKVIKDYSPETREVLNEYVAYTMVDIMKGVTTYGTAKRMRGMGIGAQVAGKTGTTNDNSDGWFMGLTPNLVTGVWVGNEDRYANMLSVDGSKMAMPIWAYYMRNVYAEGKKFGVTQKDKFEKPEDIDEKWDCATRTGFHNYGELGGIYDNQEDNAPRAVRRNVQVQVEDVSVNSSANEEDGFDF